MNNLSLWLPPDIVSELGWTLIHFLWQGLLLAALLQVVLPLCRSAVARHNWALATLAAMCLAPLATFVWLRGQESSDIALASGTMPQGMEMGFGGFGPESFLASWTGWLVDFWLAGIVLLSLRALGGLVLAQRLRQNSFALCDELLLQRFHRLQRQVGVSRPVQFLQTQLVTAPVIIGWLKPAILIPVSAITGLAPQQLDALILHELAHIRRLDAFINLTLVMVETVLFYHPAIWWVSRQIRNEREYCCDDFAVAHCGEAATYVEALTSLAIARAVPAFALSASGGALKYRVARLLVAPSDSRSFSLSAIAGLAFLSLVLGTVATAQTNAQVNKPHFEIRVVDESVDKDTLQGPKGDDRVRMAKPDKGMPELLWLKREGQIDGDALAEAHVNTSHDRKPVIEFTLTSSARNQFAEMTRNNIGHRLAVVVNGRVITAPIVMEPMLGGRGQITGDFTTEAQANALVAEMMGTNRPVKP